MTAVRFEQAGTTVPVPAPPEAKATPVKLPEAMQIMTMLLGLFLLMLLSGVILHFLW